MVRGHPFSTYAPRDEFEIVLNAVMIPHSYRLHASLRPSSHANFSRQRLRIRTLGMLGYALGCMYVARLMLPLLSSATNSTSSGVKQAQTSTDVNYYPSIHMVFWSVCMRTCTGGGG
jgi:hypothetical protein